MFKLFFYLCPIIKNNMARKKNKVRIPTRDENFQKWAKIEAGKIKDDFKNAALSHFGFPLSGIQEDNALKARQLPVLSRYVVNV